MTDPCIGRPCCDVVAEGMRNESKAGGARAQLMHSYMHAACIVAGASTEPMPLFLFLDSALSSSVGPSRVSGWHSPLPGQAAP